MTRTRGAASSAILTVEVARDIPAGAYAGLAWRYVEGVIHGEVSTAEPVAGLRALAAGRASVPYAIAFRLIAPENVSEADAVVVEAPNRGSPVVARAFAHRHRLDRRNLRQFLRLASIFRRGAGAPLWIARSLSRARGQEGGRARARRLSPRGRRSGRDPCARSAASGGLPLVVRRLPA